MKKLLPLILGTTITLSSCNFLYNQNNGLVDKLYFNLTQKIAQLERECNSIILSRYKVR